MTHAPSPHTWKLLLLTHPPATWKIQDPACRRAKIATQTASTAPNKKFKIQRKNFQIPTQSFNSNRPPSTSIQFNDAIIADAAPTIESRKTKEEPTLSQPASK